MRNIALIFLAGVLAMPCAAWAAATPADAIGTARMEPDQTLVLELSGESDSDGKIAESELRVRPGEPDYDAYVKHLGGMKPGESKTIPPWNDSEIIE